MIGILIFSFLKFCICDWFLYISTDFNAFPSTLSICNFNLVYFITVNVFYYAMCMYVRMYVYYL